MSSEAELFEPRPEDMPIIRELFREYSNWLGVDLCFQGFEEELRSLPGNYSRPRGFIYLAKVNGEAAGCIALKPLNALECEMKRLYVRPDFRGLGLGRTLAERCLSSARTIGYKRMKLDTMQRMKAAVALYRALGFEEIGAYCHNPEADVLYMAKDL